MDFLISFDPEYKKIGIHHLDQMNFLWQSITVHNDQTNLCTVKCVPKSDIILLLCPVN